MLPATVMLFQLVRELLFTEYAPPVDEQVTPLFGSVAGDKHGITLDAVQPAILKGSGLAALVVPHWLFDKAYVKEAAALCVLPSAVSAPEGTSVPLDEKP
jgi:hypothetical protein